MTPLSIRNHFWGINTVNIYLPNIEDLVRIGTKVMFLVSLDVNIYQQLVHKCNLFPILNHFKRLPIFSSFFQCFCKLALKVIINIPDVGKDYEAAVAVVLPLFGTFLLNVGTCFTNIW